MNEKKKIQAIIYWLTGNPYSVILERRILRAVALVSSLISIIIFSFALFFELEVLAWVIPMLTAFTYFLTYAAMSGHSDSYIPALFFMIFTHGVTLALWFYMRGTQSLGLPILIVITGFLPVLLKEKALLAGYLFSILTYGTIFFSGIIHPELLHNYFPEQTTFIDWMLDRIFLGYGLSGMIYMIMHSYRQKVEETAELNATLACQNTEISLRNMELKKAMEEISALRDIIPICSYCHKVRTDSGYVESVEAYITHHTNADFSHTCCPDCLKKYFPEIETV